MNQNEMKQAAAEAAIAYVEDGSVVGVGTGSTADFFIAALGKIKHRIDGAVALGGALVMDARVQVTVDSSAEVPVALTDLDVTTLASAWIGSGAVVQAASIEIISLTENRLRVERGAAG